MKQFRCYLCAVMLSLLAAFAIDAIVNYDAYKQGWASVFKPASKLQEQNKGMLPSDIRRVTGAVYYFLFR